VSNFIPKVQIVSIDTLKPAGFNPKTRTERKRLTKLIEGIREVGGIVQPIIVSQDMWIIDGHRRYYAAKALRMPEVPVIVSPLSLQVGWRVLNISTLAIASKDWIQAHEQGMDMGNLPARHRQALEEMIALEGAGIVKMLAERGLSTTVLVEAKIAAKYIEGKSRREKPSEDMVRKVLLWMIEYGQQAATRRALKAGMSRKLLLYAIENGESLDSRGTSRE